MKQSNQKLKLLYLLKILTEQTDEEHTMTVPQMIAELNKLGISAERKSIYDDLEYLRLFGVDICSQRSRTTDYFIGERDFELPAVCKVYYAKEKYGANFQDRKAHKPRKCKKTTPSSVCNQPR